MNSFPLPVIREVWADELDPDEPMIHYHPGMKSTEGELGRFLANGGRIREIVVVKHRETLPCEPEEDRPAS